METSIIKIRTNEITECTELLASKQLCYSVLPENENKLILKINHEPHQDKMLLEFYQEYLVIKRRVILQLKKELLYYYMNRRMTPALERDIKDLLFNKGRRHLRRMKKQHEEIKEKVSIKQ